MPRRFPIFQFPNPPLITAMLAGAIARTTHGPLSYNAMLLSRLALLVWSAEEVVSGANWFRRLVGVAGAAYGLAAFGGRRLGRNQNRR
ncbi:MAG TPA: hypothetical protein VIX82_17840 [Solirubrobacteraceae bacterium]